MKDNLEPGGFLDRPALRIPRPPLEPGGPWSAGLLIGPFRLVRRLGVGGMGEVWLAERATADFAQSVALKLMLSGPAGAHERFRAERQILAELDHPGIARLYDGGIAEQGWPWMAMEYVRGQDIISWCEAQGASLEQRLALFLQVCDAAAYAHAHLVVHRDLKPSNVFVTEDGRAKLLDFGIAKLLSHDLPGDATRTAHLSPAYAAPEQLQGGPVTTATDAFALGLLLHQILTGRLPWPADASLAGALKRLLHDAPELPSRVTDGRVPAKALKGDLDAIVSKALRNQPEARYADARSLADDIRRYLRSEPVNARSGARSYVARRFVRRHWLPLSAAAAVFGALFVGLSLAAWQAQRAQREAARTTAIQDFLIGVFKASDPRIAQDKPRGEITARELLDASVARIDRDFSEDPQVRIRLLGVASDIYRELGEDERYTHLHRRYLALARRFYGESHPVVLGAMLDEAVDLKDRYENAAALGRLEVLDKLIGKAGLDRSELRARWWLTRGQALLDDSSKREEQTASLSTARDLFANFAPTHPARVTALADLGTAYLNRMEFAPARQYFEEAIAVSTTVRDRNDAELATIYGNLGLLAQNLGDFAGADAAYGNAEAIIRRTYGESRPVHWVPAANRARAAHLGGNRERAFQLFDALLSKIPADSSHHDATEAHEWYATCLVAEGRAADALVMLEDAERVYQSTHLYDYELPRVRAVLGDAYDRVGRAADARRTLMAALDQRIAQNPADYQPLLAIRERWGRFLMSQGDIQGAEEQFREVLKQAHGRKLAHIALAHSGLARVELSRGRVDAALSASTQAIELYREVIGFRDVRMGPQLWIVHSEVLRQAGEKAKALEWAQRALDARRQYDHPSSSSLAEAEAAVRALQLGPSAS